MRSGFKKVLKFGKYTGYIYLAMKFIPPYKGKGILLNHIRKQPIQENDMNGDGFLTKSNVVGGITSNHPKAFPAVSIKQETPVTVSKGGSLLEKVSIPQSLGKKKVNRNNIKFEM